jgi:hypothetical protein
MMDRATIVREIISSENWKSEIRYVNRGGYEVATEPRLFKYLEDDMVRVVFPTSATEVTEGTVVAMVTLYDQKNRYNVYTHTICAGPRVNVMLDARHSQMPQAMPQPGAAGEAAIARFKAWKEAAWYRFLNEELALGSEVASAIWIANFWKALDRMFGTGHLVNYDPDQVLAAYI